MNSRIVTIKHISPREAFDNAIKEGRLSNDETAPNFAGNYMYMGTKNGRDLFKHVETRQYLTE